MTVDEQWANRLVETCREVRDASLRLLAAVELLADPTQHASRVAAEADALAQARALVERIKGLEDAVARTSRVAKNR